MLRRLLSHCFPCQAKKIRTQKQRTETDQWDVFLDHATPYFGRCYVAGGAVRDLVMDRPIKDVDVLVRWDRSPREFYDQAMMMGQERDITITRWLDNEYVEWPKADSTLVGVVTMAYFGITYQLIAIRYPEDVVWDGRGAVSRIDFGLCRGSYGYRPTYDPSGRRLWLSSEFREDASHKKFTLLRADTPDQFASSMARYLRFQEKYSEFLLFYNGCVIPETEIRKIAGASPPELMDIAVLYGIQPFAAPGF